VQSSAIRDEVDPAPILAYWGGFFDSHFALSQEPAPRRRASHMLFDVQVGWGYANASSDRIDFPLISQVWALCRDLANEDSWLFAHELGHQFQTSNWTGPDITEVTVNLFSMYTLNGYRNGGGDHETRGHKDNVIDHAALAALRWPSAYLFERLEMYRQLVFEFGWSRYKQVFASYYSADFDAARWREPRRLRYPLLEVSPARPQPLLRPLAISPLGQRPRPHQGPRLHALAAARLVALRQ